MKKEYKIYVFNSFMHRTSRQKHLELHLHSKQLYFLIAGRNVRQRPGGPWKVNVSFVLLAYRIWTW